MTNETQHTPPLDQKKLSFGARLKSVRETKGMDRKDVATQLRLSEKKIAMMEYERYPADLPVTFIRGYLRAYGRLLQIPEHDIKYAIELIQPKAILQSKIRPNTLDITMSSSSNYFMHFLTFIIILTMAGLVCMWWYTHTILINPLVADNQINIKFSESNSPILPMTTQEHILNNHNNGSISSDKNKVKPQAQVVSSIFPIPENQVYFTSGDKVNINNSTFDMDSWHNSSGKLSVY
jgi:cytoskeleton protein RodZ